MALPSTSLGARAIGALAASLVVACSGSGAATKPSAAPCFVVRGDAELRAKDADKTLEELTKSIKLAPEDEALSSPKSMADVRAILRRDTVYLFGAAAAYARTLGTLEGRIAEATLELMLGESQLVASQVLTTQAAWVGADLRIARANLASEGAAPTSDRARMFVQLIRVVEEGNKIADALGVVAPRHIARGAEVVRALSAEAPADPRVAALSAEYHRLRGEWSAFDADIAIVERAESKSPALCYLRAMAAIERAAKRGPGAKMLRECLRDHPRFVRAQAALVLVAAHPAGALREIQKLRQMNEDHYVVMLLEPTLAADKELSRMQGGTGGDDATP